jgi:hypothetical protein
MHVDHLELEEVIRRICLISNQQRDFWSNAGGWAPDEVTQLLSKARIDRHAALAGCLKLWIDPAALCDEGRLILAWANLGSIVEGTLVLCITVFHENFKDDANALDKNGDPRDIRRMALGLVRKFFSDSIWADDEKHWDNWISNVQRYRNAIHAFYSGALGSAEEFWAAARSYLVFLSNIDDRLPYHEDFAKYRWDDMREGFDG